jgi:ATP-dependent helicase/nuclease subunit A
LSPRGTAALGGEAAARRGRIIHRLLELLPQVPPANREAACRRYLARPVHGLELRAQDEIARETLAILADARWRAVFGPDSRAEVPLAGCVRAHVIVGQVDRLLVTPNSVLVVDFKTNRPVPATAAEIPVTYLKQMAAYRALLTEIYAERAVHCALLWTAAPKLIALESGLLDACAP